MKRLPFSAPRDALLLAHLLARPWGTLSLEELA
jgi:hypothetical protein